MVLLMNEPNTFPPPGYEAMSFEDRVRAFFANPPETMDLTDVIAANKREEEETGARFRFRRPVVTPETTD